MELQFARLGVTVFFPAHLKGCESLCLLKILAKDRMARKKAILVSTFLESWYELYFGLDFEEAQALTTYQLFSPNMLG
jgi:hypothetical protein